MAERERFTPKLNDVIKCQVIESRGRHRSIDNQVVAKAYNGQVLTDLVVFIDSCPEVGLSIGDVIEGVVEYVSEKNGKYIEIKAQRRIKNGTTTR